MLTFRRAAAITIALIADTYELVRDDDNGCLAFNVPHHYESQVKAVGDINNAARARRLAQEAVTLSTSLPLSPSSSVFVRCDEERLDLMKVDLINLLSSCHSVSIKNSLLIR